MAHARTARLLYGAFVNADSLDRKRILAAEIFCKLVQSVEDFGAFSLFCLSDQQNDIAEYFNVSTSKIVKFYGTCRQGLADAELDKIYGIPKVDDLIAAKHVEAADRQKCEDGHVKFRETARGHYAKLGKIFSQYDNKKEKHGHSDIVNMYFNTKHGVRVFLPTPAQALEMSLSDDKVPILIGVEKDPTRTHNDVEIGTFALSGVERMVQNTETTCGHVQALAQIRLGLRKDPFYLFNMVRRASDQPVSRESQKLGRNQPCFCQSGKKFKRCHGR